MNLNLLFRPSPEFLAARDKRFSRRLTRLLNGKVPGGLYTSRRSGVAIYFGYDLIGRYSWLAVYPDENRLDDGILLARTH